MGKDIDAIPARFADGADIGRLQWESPKLIFRAADRARIPELIPLLAERGALWIVSLKGKLSRARDVEMMAAARVRGLVDSKVRAFPIRERPRASPDDVNAIVALPLAFRCESGLEVGACPSATSPCLS